MFLSTLLQFLLAGDDWAQILFNILQADMQQSTRSDYCWSSHILSVMEGLAHSRAFKHNLLNCEHFYLRHCMMISGPGICIIGSLFPAPT